MNNQWTFSNDFYAWENEGFATKELALEAAMREYEGEFGCLIAQLDDDGKYENVINIEKVWFS